MSDRGREPDIEIKVRFDDKVGQMKKLVQLYQVVMGIEKPEKLAPKEELFFAIAVLNYHQNLRSLQHPKAKQLFEGHFPPEKLTGIISDYVGKLTKRGWIRKTEDREIDIPPFFKDNKIESSSSVLIDLECRTQES